MERGLSHIVGGASSLIALETTLISHVRAASSLCAPLDTPSGGLITPPYMAMQVPQPQDTTLFEASCRLVGQASRPAHVSQLLYPSVEVDLAAVDAALAQHIPSLAVQQRLLNGASGSKKQQADDAQQAPGWLQLPVSLLSAGRRAVLSRLPGPWQVLQHEPPPSQLLAWNRDQPILAIGHSSTGAVLIYDCSSAAAAAAAAAAADGGSSALREPQQVLVHQLQQQVSSIAWRPVHSSMLAVGCTGGVALWRLGKLPLSAAAMSRGAEGGASTAAAWTTFLHFKENCRVSSLAWSPDGTLLAGSSLECNRLMVWDVALGVGAKLRLGLVPVHLLSWSPDGNFLFAADRSGQFFLYETSTWSVRQWVSPPGSAVSAAAWAPDSSVLLLSSTGSNFLVGLHIVGRPTQLTEQLLPVALPGVSDRELTMDMPGPTDTPPTAATCISSICWDPSGNRLAVTLKAPHAAAGTAALFSTSFSPVVTCSLIGFVNPGPAPKPAAADAVGGGGEAGGGAAKSHRSSSSCSEGAEVGSRDVLVRSEQLLAEFAPVSGKASAAAMLSVGQVGGSGELCRVVNVPVYC